MDIVSQSLAAEDIAAIEHALMAQWSHFGHAPGGSWHDEGGLVWSEAPVQQLPYNAVLRTHLGSNAERRIDDVIDHFHGRGVQFMWVVHPTAQPTNLAELLEARGLAPVEQATGMSLHLASLHLASRHAGAAEFPTAVVCREVNDQRDMDAFEELIGTYWELSDESLPYVLGVSRWESKSDVPGIRWVAHRDNRPVGKVYLSLNGREDTGAIFGMYVRPEARGQGVAAALSRLAIDRAVALGKRRVVLHSSEMAAGLYRRLGFIDRCRLSVYATARLHTR